MKIEEIEKLTESDKLGFDEWPNNNTISESGMSRVVNALAGKEFAVISAYRREIDGVPITKRQNILRNRKLRGQLDARKLGGYSLVGHWIECGLDVPYDECPESEKTDVIERSYLIPKPKEMDSEEFKQLIVSLGEDYKQDAVVYADGDQIHLLFTNGGSQSFGKVTYGKIAQAYSQHVGKTDIPFVFEGVEIPSHNMGRMMFKHCGINYPSPMKGDKATGWDKLLRELTHKS